MRSWRPHIADFGVSSLIPAAPSECCDVRAGGTFLTPLPGRSFAAGREMNRRETSAVSAFPKAYASTLASQFDRFQPHVLSILRIMAGLLFCEHGMAKLIGFPPHGHMPGFMELEWFAGTIEFTGGALVALGLFTRAAAFIMSGEMAIGYFMDHAPRSFFPLLNGGEAAVLFCFVFLYFVFAGAGPWSLDALVWRKVR
jgi:putative oxidoreductase